MEPSFAPDQTFGANPVAHSHLKLWCILHFERVPFVYAAKVLGRLQGRALRRGRHLPDMPDEARRELRIALKNLL